MKNVFIILFVNFSQYFFAVNYYVSPSGNDNNDGLTTATAFETIEKSTYVVAPGDTVYIRNGVYTKTSPESLIAYLTISGTAGNPITFKNYPNENPILQMNETNWAGFSINGSDYITIDGFTIIGNNDNITLAYAQSEQLNIGNPATSGNGIAINTEFDNETNKPHHIIVRNCKISKCGGGGIYSYNADYVTIENNTIWECGWYAPYGNSGISMYQNWNSDTNNSDFKNFITGNTCYRNENFIPFYVAGSITDGNGIIIDDGRNTQNNSTLGVYLGKTYVANNLVFDNGARGIHIFESDNVLVINNTCYKNCKSPTTREGELTAFYASNVNFVNNIVAPGIEVPPISQFEANNIIALNNLFTSNESLANPVGTNTIIGNAAFVNPSTNFIEADFHLQQNSAAIGAGSTTNAPINDKDGINRLTNGTVDIGCYEYVNALNISSFELDKILVYPNPAKDYFSIQIPFNINLENIKVNVIDLQGRIVKSKILKNKFDIFYTLDLKKEIYIIEIDFVNKKHFTKLNLD